MLTCLRVSSQGAGSEAEDGDAAAEGESYQLEMMRCLRETNADNNMVGWYLSAVSGSYQAAEIVETFASYSETLERCVCLVYDSAAAVAGEPSLKAVRLGDAFLRTFKKGPLTAAAVRAAGLGWRDVFAEVPVVVRANALAKALALELRGAAPARATAALDPALLDLAAAPALERDLDLLSDCLDDVLSEQAKLGQHAAAARRTAAAAAQFRLHRRQENAQRRAAGEEPLPEDPPEGQFKAPQEPSQLDVMLLGNQIHAYSTHLDDAASLAIERLAVAQGLQNA